MQTGPSFDGNRINVFSESEYYDKADGMTHTKAIPLPYEGIGATGDFVETLFELIEHVHISNPDFVTIQPTLFE